MRYVAQPTLAGPWWVLDKKGKRAKVVLKDATQVDAQAEADRLNNIENHPAHWGGRK